MKIKASDFGDGFSWGVSASAYQTEGGWNIDGKGESIWDVFTEKRGTIKGKQNAKTTCDFYHRFADDLILMHQMNIRHFRFSIAWSRLLPDGKFPANPAGIDYYHRIIDQCLALGIEPWITLYHWDLPHELELRGGWTNRDIIGWFTDYVFLCVSLYGDKVKHWMILNEPLVFTGAGYFLGAHAPGRKGLYPFLAAVHHATLCQAEAGRVIRSQRRDCLIGTTFSCSVVEPKSQKYHDVLAAHRVDALLNRLFVEPLAGLGYPLSDLPFLRRMEPFIRQNDENLLAFNTDFIGVQNYTREIVAYSLLTPTLHARLISAKKRKVETTEMNWEVFPQGIYNMLNQFSVYKSLGKLIVTEAGSAFQDSIGQDGVNDEKRRSYLEKSIETVFLARKQGIKVEGYFVWSFTDNFEWAEGYKPRFGLVYINFENQYRTVKASGKWFTYFLKA